MTMTPTEALLIILIEAPQFKDSIGGPTWPKSVVINEAQFILEDEAWKVMRRECDLEVERNPGGPG